jgi:hypothetical protein
LALSTQFIAAHEQYKKQHLRMKGEATKTTTTTTTKTRHQNHMHKQSICYSKEINDRVPFLYHVKDRPAQPWVGVCLNPKSGSTMWKTAIVRGLMEQGIKSFNFEPHSTVHGATLPYIPQLEEQLSPSDPSTLKYTLERHPTTRLLSGYLGKVEKRGRNAVRTEGYNTTTGFPGFIKWLTALDQDDPKINSHFRLQTGGCGFAQGIPYRVLRTEEIGHWYREVVCRLGLQDTVSNSTVFITNQQKEILPCFLKTHDCGCTVNCGGSSCNESHAGTFPDADFGTINNATAVIEQYYTDELAQMVNDWAQADLVAFGYKPWLRGQNI